MIGKYEFPAFRVWIEKYEQMFNVKTLFDCGCFTLYDPQESEEWPVTECLEEGTHLMQGIGYEDINGKEIYEGDVVLCEWGEIGDNIYRNTGKTVVDFSPHNLVMLEEADRLQILGNIYENPELLEEVSK